MPRVPGINVYPSSQPPGQQIPIGNNTGSLPDLSNVHFPSPLHTPLDQEEHSSGSPYSNNHLSVPVNHRFLHSCKQGLTLENNSSASQQDVRISYSQQQQASQTHSQVQAQTQPQNVPGSTSSGHYVYQQQPHSPLTSHSPLAPQSPNASQAQVHQQNAQGQFNSLGSYRTSQMVNRPSPQSSPSLTFQESPLSYSNNPSAPSSPTGHHQANLTLDPQDQNVFINQVHADFEQFSMIDSPSTTIGPYMNSPSHTGTYTQSDILSVASELGSGDGGYFSTSPLQQLAYHTRTPTTTQQLTPQTPNTPTITLTDCSLGPDDLVSSDFGKDFGPSIAVTFGQDLFSSDDALAQDLNSLRQEDINALRQDLDPLDLDELQRLANSDMVISDPTTEADFRLEQR